MGRAVDPDLAETETPAQAEHQDNAKRLQIMDGAREVFLAQGFDAASMGAIARKAGVSKGTLYVYFDGKEQLFEAIAP
jgi:AcrR family transcriptional regulator